MTGTYVPTLKHPAPGNYFPSAGEILAPFLSGESAFEAMREAVGRLVQAVPQDHDVLILAHGILVTHVQFVSPHTLIFTGSGADDRHQTALVCHFSQLLVRVVYAPKRGPERIVTGFAPL
jgi:hypothetical protein